jgi:NADH:ubiquinone oxidoreductase subunit F (NADH-binding)
MSTSVERVLPLTEPVATLDHYLATGGGEGLAAATSLDRESVIAEVRAAGLRGRGGAGFPTATKWAAAGTGAGPVHLVCNAAEGELGTFKDRYVLRRNPYQVLEGIAIAAYAIGARRAFIAIKRTFETEIATLYRALDEVRAAGLLGQASIQVVLGPDEYLFGEEKAMVEVIEGGNPLPRILPPYQVGLFAKRGMVNPTVVNNVETLAHVPRILRSGAAEFRSSGTDDSPGTTVFTLSGDIRVPGVHELPLGLPLRMLVNAIGGGARNGRYVKAVFCGAAAAPLTEAHLDTPLDFTSMREAGSALGSAGFVVYDDTACIVAATLAFCRFLAVESCAQCPACKHGNEEIVSCLKRIERGSGDQSDVDTLLSKCGSVTGGQRCFLPTGTSLLVRGALTSFADEFAAHLGRPCPLPRDLPVPKLVDFDEQAWRFRYDERYRLKRADWSYRT